ncbi:copper resistance protein NlpE N-terminal domain-containing protein [Lutimonas sp.]|uniref:copper resistance protein NlpE N-terminal domain-containing protein n=1 Tax=Lutimonas sp. TaxID=1872403 RepID=UPI003D9B98E7
MKSVILSSIAVSMLFVSCGSSSSSSTYQDPHSRMHSQMHNELYQEEIEKELNKQVGVFAGIYNGTIPCKSCDGIEMSLELNEDFSYEASTNFKGNPEKNETAQGTYDLHTDGIVALDKPISGMLFFQKKGTELIILDENAKEIIAIDNAAYFLRLSAKKKGIKFESDDPAIKLLMTKWDEGLLFQAKGQDGNWALQMKNTDSISFISPDGILYKFKGAKPLPSMDPAIIDYRIVSDKAEILLQLTEKPCETNTENPKQTFQVTLNFKETKKKESQTLEGCGTFVPNYKLSGKWKIIEVDGTEINDDSFPNKEAYLILDPFEGTVSGNDGCNGFFGKMTNKGYQVSFGPTAGTLMACTNADLSAVLMGAISDKTVNYQLSNHLSFFAGDKKVMVLKRFN